MICPLCENSTACPVHDPEMYPHVFVRPAAGKRCELCGKKAGNRIHVINGCGRSH